MELTTALRTLSRYGMTSVIHKKESGPMHLNLFQKLKRHVPQISIFASPDHQNFKGLEEKVKYVICDNAADICAGFTESFVAERAALTIVCFGDMAECEAVERAVCAKHGVVQKSWP
jgi:hypothetical protein